ncbi:preprotein translocase subunit SecG [Rhodoplanes sp. TEM]|uniref:Protein-export membrane protein SecG n=1 Tax=Rhodoplanes tepidamans TaxID=200616 RepID=A0ABT5JA03_RHOTP|nr:MULTISPECIES: preprotein translocase subunit SecG [Rhodoplanes]MDC7786434.1 preprotein translocase subunit SecG [Rhodoplanes tepidamans]MDC7985076.1 preprotein translocase subunit SecG [Rhodoplanes sp. TEM]MDQ0357319.1 preprotein translocase subunit SecG [Rhodoplanes tepidamans]
MQTVVIVVHLMIVLAMIGLVLLQRSEGGALGIGGGGGFMSNRGSGNALTRATAILAAAFFVTSLLLSVLAGLSQRPTTVIPAQTGPSAPSPGAPTPLGTGGGVLDQLQRNQPAAPAAPGAPAAPAAPAAPSGPEVPRSQ